MVRHYLLLVLFLIGLGVSVYNFLHADTKAKQCNPRKLYATNQIMLIVLFVYCICSQLSSILGYSWL